CRSGQHFSNLQFLCRAERASIVFPNENRKSTQREFPLQGSRAFFSPVKSLRLLPPSMNPALFSISSNAVNLSYCFLSKNSKAMNFKKVKELLQTRYGNSALHDLKKKSVINFPDLS
ncbi:MAG: hypothetical protein ACHQT8_08125, partial [Chlamydiales bacterium]